MKIIFALLSMAAVVSAQPAATNASKLSETPGTVGAGPGNDGLIDILSASAVVGAAANVGLPVLSPAGQPGSCASVSCEWGFRCEMKPEECQSPPCLSKPTCVLDQPDQPQQAGQQPKNGTCPSSLLTLSLDLSSCINECQLDADCPGTKKCCSGPRCGTSCQEPAAGNILTVLICPASYSIIQRSVPCSNPPCETIVECVKIVV